MAAILRAERLNKQFGAVVAADDISLAIESDQVMGIIGANGAGKTTFVNMVTGYLKPDSGHIFYRDRDITPLTSRQITRLGIHRSFQIPQIFGELNVVDNLMVAIGISARDRAGFWRPLRAARVADEAEALMQRYQIETYRDQAAGLLPQGVRKLLDIAMAMVGEPQVLLLDEPTSGISVDEKFDVMDTIMAALSGAAVTTMFIEHDMDVIGRYADRVVAFYDGGILADGTPDQVLADEDVRAYVVGPDHPATAGQAV